jgi:3-oxoadipate CoA-transferase beta subunit
MSKVAQSVDRVHTDRAVFDITPDGLAVRETFDTTVDELRELLGLDLKEIR